MNLNEWREKHFNIVLRFKDFWSEMNSYWPSSFPLNMAEDRWDQEFAKWLEKGRPYMVSGSDYFDEK